MDNIKYINWFLGGVGVAAVQLARTKNNIKIFGTGSENKKDSAYLQGVDVFINNDSIETEVKKYKFDVIVANRAGPLFTIFQNQLKPLGRIVITGIAVIHSHCCLKLIVYAIIP